MASGYVNELHGQGQRLCACAGGSAEGQRSYNLAISIIARIGRGVGKSGKAEVIPEDTDEFVGSKARTRSNRGLVVRRRAGHPVNHRAVGDVETRSGRCSRGNCGPSLVGNADGESGRVTYNEGRQRGSQDG